MKNKRNTITATEFCSSVRDGTHDSPKRVSIGRPLITSKHIIGGEIDFSKSYKISEQDYQKIIKRSKVELWDVLITMIGTVGEPCIIRQAPNFAIKNVGLFKTKDETSAKWLYYFLLTPDAQNYIWAQSRGTTQAYIPLGTLREMPIPIPEDKQEMSTIISILDALDSKIIVNKEINNNLHTMARALYKSWFVDFDPVVAKATGKKPFGMDDETAALFPDRFVDSELGPIPEGWEVQPISSIVNILSGGTPKTKEASYWGGNIPWFSVVDTPSPGNVFVIDTEKHITKAGVDNSAAKIYRPRTVIITARGTVGNVVMSANPMAFNQSCYGIHGKTGYDDFFIFFTVKELVEELQRIAHGSVFDTITRKTFDSVKMPIPTPQIAKHYNNKISPWLDLIKSNLLEAKTLNKLRDILLPKLISGEIRIKDAEKVVEEVL